MEETPEDGAPARLTPEDARHATTVLRLGAGDRVLGLDGRGHAWPLEITSVTRKAGVELAPAGEPSAEPAPGTSESAVPRLRVAFSLLRAGRLEPMVDRLVQLGATELAPFVAAHTPVRSRTLGDRARERLVKIARAACKQSGRLWEPTIAPVQSLGEVAAAWSSPGGDEGPAPAAVVLDPAAESSLADWIASRRETDAHDFALYVGPEGGFAEEDAAVLAEARPAPDRARIAPYILRVETAAEVACGIVVHLAER